MSWLDFKKANNIKETKEVQNTDSDNTSKIISLHKENIERLEQVCLEKSNELSKSRIELKEISTRTDFDIQHHKEVESI